MHESIQRKLILTLVFGINLITSMAKGANQGFPKISIKEIFAQVSVEAECFPGRLTIWDEKLDRNVKLYKEDLDVCQKEGILLTEKDCLSDEMSRWPGNIRYSIQRILASYQKYLSESQKPESGADVLSLLKGGIRDSVHELLVLRDSVENTKLFDEIFNAELLAILNNTPPNRMKGRALLEENWKQAYQWASHLLKGDRALLREISDLKTFYPSMPYGSNICQPTKKVPAVINSKTLSECVIEQDTFIQSVKFDRTNEVLCEKRTGKHSCPSVTHGVTASSIQPCGRVVGTWQADSNGKVISNMLKIIPPDSSTPVPFDAEVLQRFIGTVDHTLKVKRNILLNSSSAALEDGYTNSNPQ